MKFEKRNFMGIELDVLVGHPEHDLLFIATQVARTTGLKSPSYATSVTAGQVGKEHSIQWGTLRGSLEFPKGLGRPLIRTTWMFTEGAVYRMLMRGNTDKAKEFQDWIANEVAPSIRKTGKYNAEDSQNPIAVAIMDELKSLRGEIVSLRQELQAKTFSLAPTTAAQRRHKRHKTTKSAPKMTIHCEFDQFSSQNRGVARL